MFEKHSRCSDLAKGELAFGFGFQTVKVVQDAKDKRIGGFLALFLPDLCLNADAGRNECASSEF